MKKIITILLLNTMLFVFAQNDIVSRFNAISVTNLPFNGTRTERAESSKVYHFPYKLWSLLNVNAWQDLKLTIPISPETEGWNVSDLYRRFSPNNGNYYMGLITFGEADFTKTMLVTATPDGNYIDALEVSARISSLSLDLCAKQWKINSNMTVTTYQLKPIASTSLVLYDNAPSHINSQRIDTVYQIDSTGSFMKVNQILYQPQTYAIDVFSNQLTNIWDGSELPLK